MAINKISQETISAIMRKTAFKLPDNPSEQGMKAADIKKAFYQFISDATVSIYAEVNRIVEEANTDISSKDTTVDTHTTNKNNPHEVTKAQVGLGNCDNTSDMDKPVSTAQSSAIQAVDDLADGHIANTENPHSVTASQVGLGNCDNTSDLDKPISTAAQTALDLKADKSDIVDNLTTEDAEKMLSAKQGKALHDAIPTGYGKTIESTYVAATGVLSVILKDENNNVLATATTDLPLELLLASSGSYYDSGVLYLKLANGNFINVDVSDLVSTYTADGQTISLSNDGAFSISTTYKAKIDDSYSVKHSHTNKDLLDTYTQTEADLDDAVDKKHSHSNKTVLDNTTASFTTAQSTALANSTKTSQQITIVVADWSGGTSCTKSIAIAKADNVILYSPNESNYAAFNSAEIRVSAQANGQLTFTCIATPEVDITVEIVAIG